MVLAASATGAFWLRRGSALEEFWQPFLRSPRPVTLCVAHPAVYRLGPTGQMMRDPDHYVGVGDALALAQLAARFSHAGKTARLRPGDDTSFADLRSGPAVLIGAYTNQWTLEIMRDLRFVFERDAASIWIRDRHDPARRWTYVSGTDYALISRVFDSKTGEPVVVAAGLSHFGTQVAGEFLTSEACLAPALGGAPAGWNRKNLQLALQADVIGKTPGPPKVVASWFW